MNMCTAPFKCVIFILNTLFWLVGAFLMYAGIKFVLSNDGSFGQVSGWPAVILLTSAAVLIIGGIAGCVGAVTEKKACLGLFLVFLASVLIVQFSIGGVMVSMKSDTNTKFSDFVLTQFQQYGNETINVNDTNANFNSTSFVDITQTNLECCGFANYTDWTNPSASWFYNNTSFVPLSCCKPSDNANVTCTGNATQTDLIYTDGCEQPITKAFKEIYDILLYAAFGIGGLILIGILIVIGFLCRTKNQPFAYSHISPGYTRA